MFKVGDKVTPNSNTYPSLGIKVGKPYTINGVRDNNAWGQLIDLKITEDAYCSNLRAIYFKLAKPRKPVTLGMLVKKGK